jgi:IS5 family transposase
VALIQESLSVAHKTGALATGDLERVVVDTTVQPKAIAHPIERIFLQNSRVNIEQSFPGTADEVAYR